MLIGMRNERPRDSENARIALQRAVRQLGQLAVEAARQVIANFANLLLDDVKIIYQPFGRRCDRALFTDCGGGTAIHFEQHACGGAYPRRHRTSCAGPVRNALGNRKCLAMLFETLDTEQFGANRFLRASRERRGQALPGPQKK